jgi:hypothetical protein
MYFRTTEHNNHIDRVLFMTGTITKPIDTARGRHLQDLLNNNQNLFFDEHIFAAACKDLGQSSEAEIWSRNVPPYVTGEDMILAVPEEMREQFLVLYIYHFNRHLVV